MPVSQWTTHKIIEWQRETFGCMRSIHGAAEHLRREAEEILDTTVCNENRDAIAEEVADAYFMVVQMMDLVSASFGIDMGDVVKAKLAKNRGRTWKQPDHMGVVEHEK